MSPPPRPPHSAEPPPARARLSLGHLARARAKTIVAVWLLLAAVLVVRVMGGAGIDVDGDVLGLLAPEDRPAADESMLLLQLRADAQSAAPDTDKLVDAAAAVSERLGEERVPIAPPRAELTGWLDTHALYLLPPTARAQLAERLTDEAMTGAIEDLRARLSSPLYGVSDDDPRRDPLDLRTLAGPAAAPLSAVGRTTGQGAEATAAGDLLSRDGSALLMQLRSPKHADALQEEVLSAIGDRPVDAAIVGPEATSDRIAATMRGLGVRVFSLVLAGLALVLALALRAVRPVVAILLAVGTGVGTLVWFAPDVDPYGATLVILLCGFGCEGALHLQRISARGWPGAAVMGTALLPLWMSPYPVWQRWSVWWLAGIAIIVLVLRLAMPALIAIVGGPSSLAGAGFRLRPSRFVAVVLSVGALSAGAWAAPRLSFRGVDRLATDVEDPAGADRLVRDDFFDTTRIVEARSRGDTPAAALERAAIDVRALRTLVPTEATRIDSPGRLVLTPNEIESSRTELAALNLRQRMSELRSILEARGFRADAFGEFLRSSADLQLAPTATRAIEGPLGHWVLRYVETDDEGQVAIRSLVHLRPDAGTPVPDVTTDDGKQLRLTGPAVAARRDRSQFADQLGIWVAAQLWLGALFVWLGTRSLPVALAAAVTALASQTAVLCVMIPLRIPLGPHLLPALLLVGASALVAGARACQAVALGRPLFATGLLVTGLCQVVAGLALVGTGVTLWTQIGLTVAIGASIASGAGMFVAPGLARLFSLRVSGDDDAREGGSNEGTEQPREDDDDDEEERR